MNLRVTAVLIAVLTLSSPSEASLCEDGQYDSNIYSCPKPFEATSCLTQSLEDVHRSITDYARFKDLDDGKNPLKIGGKAIGDADLVNMYKSFTHYKPNVENGTVATVLFTMQPYNLSKESEKEVFPRFSVLCESQIENDQFTQACLLRKKKERFGIVDFFASAEAERLKDDVKLVGGITFCKKGSTLLKYKVEYVTRNDDVERIKNRVAEHINTKIKQSAGGLFNPKFDVNPIIDQLFDQELFFTTYYQNFYQAWLEDTRKNY